MRTRRAAIAAAHLSLESPRVQRMWLGKLVSELTEAEAARAHRRLTRGTGGRAMSLEGLVGHSGRRARARVTHPGKRAR